jgi:hypothetical protein
LVTIGLVASSSRAAAQTGEVRAELTLIGDVPAGEIHGMAFDDPAANWGQTGFTVCGGTAPACAAKTYDLQFTQLPEGSTFTYRFERIAPDGTVTAYFKGTGVVGEVDLIQAEFRYGTLPNTSLVGQRTRAPAWPVGLVVVLAVPLAWAVGRRILRD